MDPDSYKTELQMVWAEGLRVQLPATVKKAWKDVNAIDDECIYHNCKIGGAPAFHLLNRTHEDHEKMKRHNGCCGKTSRQRGDAAKTVHAIILQVYSFG